MTTPVYVHMYNDFHCTAWPESSLFVWLCGDREGREDWCWCLTTNTTNTHAMIKQFSQQVIMQHKFPAHHHLIQSVISQNLLFICFRLYVFGRNNVIRVDVDNRKEAGAVRWNNDVVFCCEKKRNEYMDKALQNSIRIPQNVTKLAKI